MRRDWRSVCVRLPRDLMDKVVEISELENCSRDEAVILLLRRALGEHRAAGAKSMRAEDVES